MLGFSRRRCDKTLKRKGLLFGSDAKKFVMNAPRPSFTLGWPLRTARTIGKRTDKTLGLAVLMSPSLLVS